MSLSDLVMLGAIRYHYNEDFSKTSVSSPQFQGVTREGIFVDKTYFFVDGFGVVVRDGYSYRILPCSRTDYRTIVDKAVTFHKSDLDASLGNPKSDVLLYLRDNGYNINSSDLLRLSIPAIFTKAYPEFVIYDGYAEYK